MMSRVEDFRTVAERLVSFRPPPVAHAAALTVLATGILARSAALIGAGLGMGVQWLIVVGTERRRQRAFWRRMPLIALSRSLVRDLAHYPHGARLGRVARALSGALRGAPVTISVHDHPDVCFPAEPVAPPDFVLPLVVNDQVIGSFGIGTTDGWAFDRADIDALEEIGREISALIQVSRLTDLASIDSLTRLPRRHVVEMRIAHELDRASRTDECFSVLMCDVDHFKRINDRHGHAAGDAVLREIARILETESRTIDLVGRWGGEEFIIVLAETAAPGAIAAAEKLRAAVERATFNAGERTIRVTISIGTVTTIDAFPDVATVVAAADEALYSAKRGGRNRISVYSHDADSPTRNCLITETAGST